MAKRKGKKMNVKRTIITLVAVYVVCHLIYSGSSIVNLKVQQRQLAHGVGSRLRHTNRVTGAAGLYEQ